MSSIKIKEYIEKHKEDLKKNPNISKVNKTIQYSPEFKIKAVELKIAGYSNREIFELNGLPYRANKATNYISRWKSQYELYGKESFYKESRGRNINGKAGRPKKEEISVEEKVLIQERIIEAQRLEIEALKKQLRQGR